MMPMPNHCIECDKPASLLLNEVPYCVKHYKEELKNPKKEDKKN